MSATRGEGFGCLVDWSCGASDRQASWLSVAVRLTGIRTPRLYDDQTT